MNSILYTKVPAYSAEYYHCQKICHYCYEFIVMCHRKSTLVVLL